MSVQGCVIQAIIPGRSTTTIRNINTRKQANLGQIDIQTDIRMDGLMDGNNIQQLNSDIE